MFEQTLIGEPSVARSIRYQSTAEISKPSHKPAYEKVTAIDFMGPIPLAMLCLQNGVNYLSYINLCFLFYRIISKQELCLRDGLTVEE